MSVCYLSFWFWKFLEKPLTPCCCWYIPIRGMVPAVVLLLPYHTSRHHMMVGMVWWYWYLVRTSSRYHTTIPYYSTGTVPAAAGTRYQYHIMVWYGIMVPCGTGTIPARYQVPSLWVWYQQVPYHHYHTILYSSTIGVVVFYHQQQYSYQ